MYGKLRDALEAGRKIEAIKELRTLSSCGLKEAKDTVEGSILFGKLFVSPAEAAELVNRARSASPLTGPRTTALRIEWAPEGGYFAMADGDIQRNTPPRVLFAASSIDEVLSFVRGRMT